MPTAVFGLAAPAGAGVSVSAAKREIALGTCVCATLMTSGAIDGELTM
jgi:hypothetical protein